MRVTRVQAEENRKRIIDTASTLFRERGFDGIGIADLMAAAGLTHGGFYNNFSSKDELAALASESAFERARARFEVNGSSESHTFETVVRSYLSGRHRDEPGQGCALTTLAAEAARRGGTVQSTFARAIEAYLRRLVELAPGETAQEKRFQAVTALAEMVGAVVLARATDDRELSDELLKSVEMDILGAHKNNVSADTTAGKVVRRSRKAPKPTGKPAGNVVAQATPPLPAAETKRRGLTAESSTPPAVASPAKSTSARGTARRRLVT